MDQQVSRTTHYVRCISDHVSQIKGGISRFWPLLLPLILLIPSLHAFPYPPAPGAYSDLALAHYPNAVYLRRMILEGFRVPLWSPLILSGSPFAANPLSGLWYPPGWLALFFPLPFGFNLLIALHLLWGGLGMVRLLRAEGLSNQAALLGALAFEAMPKLFAHYGAGHLTLLYALPWTPWLLWAGTREDVTFFRRRSSWGEGLILALIFLADVRWAVYAGVMWWGYYLAHSRCSGAMYDLAAVAPRRFKRRSAPGTDQGNEVVRAWASLRGCLSHLLSRTFLAFLLAGPLALPLLEFTRLSTRVRLAAEDVLAFSLPLPRYLGLIFPDFGGYHEWVLYPGVVVLTLSLLALFWISSKPGSKFWAWSAGLSLLISLGSSLPFLVFLARLPLFNLLRVPTRALFISGLSLSALAAYAVQRLLDRLSSPEQRRGGLPLVALVAFTLALSAGIWMLSGDLALNFAWGAGLLTLGVIWIGLRLTGRVPARLWYLGLVSLCLLDWGAVDHSLFSPRSVDEVFAEGRQVARYLDSQAGMFRVYSPSYSLPQQTSANYGVQLADGVDPLQLESYVSYMEVATGVPWTGYSVTLPPFAQGDPSRDNASYRPDPARLGLLNVRYVAAEFDLYVEGLEFLSEFGRTRLYRNLQALPRAWVQPLAAQPGKDARAVDLVRWMPDRIELRAQGPGLLVLSEVAYPGWRARLDGESTQVELVGGLLRGVRLKAGEHDVVFSFHPLSLYVGLFLAGVGTLFLVVQCKPKGEAIPL